MNFQQGDPGLRVIIEPGSVRHAQTQFPDASMPWTLRYEWIVPPLPRAASWDPNLQSFYIWGDVDFELYGQSNRYPISPYMMSQIVPQLMIGRVLSGNTPQYHPTFSQFDTWMIQAQYYWAQGTRQNWTSYDLTGPAVPVSPGDLITSSIKYNPRSGAISASVSSGHALSKIVIPRPFLNEDPPPYRSWREFFERAQAQSDGLFGRAPMNVETHGVQQDAMCSVLPFRVLKMKGPDFPASSSDFLIRKEGNFGCPTPMVEWTR